MAAELELSASSGSVYYFLIRDRVGLIWNGSAFEAYVTANLSTYAVAATEQGTASAFFVGTFPATAAAGVYNVIAKRRVGGSAAETDPTVGQLMYQWTGSASFPLSDLATSGQVAQFAPIRLARKSMVNPFPVYLRSSTDHVTPFTSGVVSGQIMRGSGAWGPLQSGAFVEKGNGFFDLQALTSGDTDANTFSLLFTAVGISGGASDPLALSFVTQRVSGVT